MDKGKKVILKKMMEIENIDQQTRLIEEQEIVKMAEDINFEQVYQDVFKLYGANWDKLIDDIILTMKKLDFEY